MESANWEDDKDRGRLKHTWTTVINENNNFLFLQNSAVIHTISWQSTFITLQQKLCITGSSLLVQFLVAMLPLIFSTAVLLLLKNQGGTRSNYFFYCIIAFCYETPTHTGRAFKKINFCKFYFQPQRMHQSPESHETLFKYDWDCQHF